MIKHPPKCVLIIEDDNHIAEGLKLNLGLQGYEVMVASDGLSGIRLWEEIKPDLIVLDIMLPGIDGLSVLRNIRLKDERLPILVLSAKAALDDKIKGLSYGVDDYLTKPFNLEEFLLRVDRLLKRAAWSQEGGIEGDENQERFMFGDNVIDFENSQAICQQGMISLTEQEVKLLKLFISNQGKPLSRQRLLEIGWGYKGNLPTRTVDNFIVRLRKYFEKNPKNPQYFRSLRSVGYVFGPKTEQ
jgi:DNA-binding response OmpR family regulator